MAISLVESKVSTTLDNPVNLITVTLDNPPDSGDLLIVDGVRALGTGVNGSVLSRTGFLPLSHLLPGPNIEAMDLLYRVAQAGDPAAMQFDWGGTGGSSGKSVMVSRWSGFWGLDPFGSENNVADGVSPNSVDLTPPAGREALLYYQATYAQGTSGTPGANLTEINDGFITGGNNPRVWSAYRIVPSTSGSAYNGAVTWGNCCFSGNTIRVASFLIGQPVGRTQVIVS